MLRFTARRTLIAILLLLGVLGQVWSAMQDQYGSWLSGQTSAMPGMLSVLIPIALISTALTLLSFGPVAKGLTRIFGN